MMRHLLLIALAAGGCLSAAELTVTRAKRDFAPTANPKARHWKRAPVLRGAVNPMGEAAGPADAFDFKVQWTGDNLYFLFICPYDQLNLKPNPDAKNETNKLWEWDVTEIFVGADFDNINHYREYQVSPQAEWVDLDIDRKKPLPEGGWKWNSDMKVAARVDRSKKIWYGEMMIPIRSIMDRAPKPGDKMRLNVYRLTGVAPKRTSTMWTPTRDRSHHTPEAFGTMVLGN